MEVPLPRPRVVGGDHPPPAEATLSEHVAAFETQRARVGEAFFESQVALVESFEQALQALHRSYASLVAPQAHALFEIKHAWMQRLSGSVVSIKSDTFDTYMARFGRQPGRVIRGQQFKGVTVASSRRKQGDDASASKRDIDVHDPPQLEKVLREVSEFRRSQAHIDAIQAVLPQVTPARALAALEKHKSNRERATMMLIEEESRSQPAAPVLPGWPSAAAVSDPGFGSSSRSPPTRRQPRRRRAEPQASTPVRLPSASFHYVTLSVVQVYEVEEEVELVMLLDRNFVPVDQNLARHFRIPLLDVMDLLKAHILNSEERFAAERAVQERTAVITYQVGNVDEGEFLPIHISPEAISMHDYQMEWDPDTEELVSFRHKKDGAVQFVGVLDEGQGILSSARAVDIYTQELGPLTMNVVHMHLDDTRDDVTFDMVNLTGREDDTDDVYDFSSDASGRPLSYRIVVRDSRVEALLYQRGDGIQRAEFVEHRVPAVGALVRLPNNNIARVERVPRGMIVSADESYTPAEEDADEYELANRGNCPQKHPAEMPGGLVLQLLTTARGQELLPEQRFEECAVCFAKSEDGLDLHLSALVESGTERALACLSAIEAVARGEQSMDADAFRSLRDELESLVAVEAIQASVPQQQMVRAIRAATWAVKDSNSSTT